MFYTVNVVENGIAEYRRINYNNHMRQEQVVKKDGYFKATKTEKPKMT